MRTRHGSLIHLRALNLRAAELRILHLRPIHLRSLELRALLRRVELTHAGSHRSCRTHAAGMPARALLRFQLRGGALCYLRLMLHRRRWLNAGLPG
jgi:hypothetical protein